MSYMALYRKFRPDTLADVKGQEHIVTTLKNQLAAGRIGHAYLFTGTRGTGKTTVAKILARAVNCENPTAEGPCGECRICRAIAAGASMNVIEIDAASNNGVDNIREIREEVNYSPAALKMRVYIIDEVHMLSAGAFNALLKTLEEPPEHALFILATTEIHKVPATILSRCQRYDFRRITPAAVADRLLYIAGQEGLTLEKDAALLLARLGDGSMRDAISLLDRCAAGDAVIDQRRVQQCLGVAENQTVMALFQAASRQDAAGALEIFYVCYQQGRDIVSLFDELLSLIRDLYIVQAVATPGAALESSYFTLEELRQAAQGVSPALLEFFVQTIGETLSRLTRSAIRRADAEICLLKLCRGPVSALQPAVLPAASAARPVSQPAPAKPIPEQPIPAAPAEAAQPAPASSGGDPETRDQFFAALKGSPMNPAAATYVRLAEYQAKGAVLLIAVDEEGLLLLDRPRVLNQLESAAQKCGFSAVRLQAKGAPAEAAGPASDGLEEVLRAARELGVDVTEK